MSHSPDAATIASSLVLSKLDYCNSLLYVVPSSTLDKLQRVQNISARIVTQSSSRTSAEPLLQSLHWLPVRRRIHYKLALLTYKVQSTSTPSYLSQLLRPHVAQRTLRSCDAPRLSVPRTRTELGKRAFSVAAPTVWNALPSNLRCCDNLDTFRKHLKTFLFTHPNLP